MAKDPAFLFYTGDFSTGTQFFSDEQVGKYMRLLMAQHQLGHLEEKHMLQICKSYDKDVFSKFIKDSSGLYFNERLEEEIIKRKNYSKSRAENRATKKNISNTYVEHMESENIYVLIKPSLNGEGDHQKFVMVVVEMMKIWMKYRPEYTGLVDADYPALLNIAYLMAKSKGWKKADVVDEKEQEVLQSWDKISKYLGGTEPDKFLRGLTIDGVSIPKNFQKVVESMKAGKSAIAEKQNLLEKTRIKPEDYFKE